MMVEKYHCLLRFMTVFTNASLDPLLSQINPLGVIHSLDSVQR